MTAAGDASGTSARVAFASYRGAPDLSPDDRLAVEPLRRRGVAVVAAVWDAPVDWTAFDAVVVRSTWDYHRRADEFQRWIDRLEALGVPVWNPPSVLRWNADKRYLRDLAARGVTVVPTRWAEGHGAPSLAALLAEAGWEDAVVKPVVSASAHETWRTGPSVAAEHEPRFRALAARPGAMVQPFIAAVRDPGEWSLCFVGGAFSHAVLKRPGAGDFRAQADHGATIEKRMPPPAVLDAARRAISAAPSPWLYARADGCEVDGRFLLMELEMLEPSLYLSHDPAAPERLADAITARLR